MISYNPAFSACEKGAEWLLPFELLKDMQGNLKADVVSYNAAISACGKGARWLLPFELFEDMQGNLKAEVISYNAAISTHEKGAECVLPIELSEEMNVRCLHPDTSTVHSSLLLGPLSSLLSSLPTRVPHIFCPSPQSPHPLHPSPR